MARTTGQRFASVGDAPCDPDDIEIAMVDAAQTLAGQKGYRLVRGSNGYILGAPGVVRRFGHIEDVAQYIRKAPPSTQEAFAGAGCTVDLGLPENALQAVFVAFDPIEERALSCSLAVCKPFYQSELAGEFQ